MFKTALMEGGMLKSSNLFFVKEDWRAVLDIPLSQQWGCDEMYWWPDKHGCYTAKSAY